MVRNLVVALLLAVFGGAHAQSVAAQARLEPGADLTALAARVQERFGILPIANGIVLTPKFTTTISSIEIADGTIAIDGSVTTGAELRNRLGADADLVLRLSYLDFADQRALLGIAAPLSPGERVDPESSPDERSSVPRPRRSSAIVRFGGSVTVASDEIVTGDIVVIGGSADVDGEVTGDVVVIGGSLTLGPNARVRRDVTVVGGSLIKDPAATISGDVHEVGVGDAIRRRDGARERLGWWRSYSVRPLVGFAGTFIRVALMMLLAGVILLVARTPVEQIAERAAAEPLKAWGIGVLIELLFVPVLVLTVVALAVSIIGIPLLLLVPVAIVAFVLVCLVGFTGVAYHVGQLVEGRIEQFRGRPYLATLAGIVVIVSPLLVARVIGLAGGFGFIAGLFVVAGFMLEYVAWTTGIGAAALARFGRPMPLPPPVVPSAPAPAAGEQAF